ncbi:MAG: HAD-IB family phosphatase, partial [Spirochaetes bacterium]|nr:HAD-IB family phosphatase [Spirochaetota bacterium]
MKNNETIHRAVFSDFDGTITADETFIGVMREFAPEAFGRAAPEMVTGRITLRDGVRRVLESIPSRRYPEVLEYIKDKPLRPGFEDFLKFLKTHSIPFIIISGGLRGLVETRLGPLLDQVHD